MSKQYDKTDGCGTATEAVSTANTYRHTVRPQSRVQNTLESTSLETVVAYTTSDCDLTWQSGRGDLFGTRLAASGNKAHQWMRKNEAFGRRVITRIINTNLIIHLFMVCDYLNRNKMKI